jgi:tetratricopeptide (TPR) repeat protein
VRRFEAATTSSGKGVQVASRTSSFAFKETDLDLREIGRRLGVQSLLEGTVRRGDGRVRVSVRLVSVVDGYQRWSDSYDGAPEDALLIQEGIARSIVETLQGQIGSAAHRVTRSGTTDPEAYDLYLRALYFRRQSTEQGLLQAVEHYQAALKRAPDFARAHAALAETYCVIGYNEFRSSREIFPAAARAAREALRHDTGIAAAYSALGYVALYHDWDWAGADREFRRAIELDQNYALARQWYGNYLTAMGRFDEAEAEIRRAAELDPLRVFPRAVIGWVWFYKGDFERAVSQIDTAIAVSPTQAMMHLWRGQSLEMLGRQADALAAYRRAVEFSEEGAVFLAALARGHAAMGERAEAERLLTRIAAGRTIPAYEIAKVYLALGQTDEALRWLEHAFQARAHSMVFLRVDPQLGPLRGDPRFEELATRVGL